MPYRFTITGCGNIAGRHAEHITSLAKLVGVCDIDHYRATSLGSKHGAKIYTDHEQMLREQKPDVAVICTPNGSHAAHAASALMAGTHVLCEKPLTIDFSSGKELIATAKRSGKKLFVVKQNRFNPPVMAVKRLLEEGKLGKITGFHINCAWNRPPGYYDNSWRGTLELDGGTLFTQFSHFIDILYWFLGDITKVSGWRMNYMHPGIAIEDAGVANIIMQSGAIGTLQYTINAFAKNMEGSFTLFGEKGTVKIGGQYLNTIEYFSVENEPVPQFNSTNIANNYGSYTGSMSNHGKVYEELIKALDDPGYKFLEAEEALESVKMIEQIYAASPFVKNI